MSIAGRIEELSGRHSSLEQQIHEEQKRPAADTIRIQKLKQQKLRIKDELNNLRKSAA